MIWMWIILILSPLADVLSEDTIIKWYKGGHSSKGKNVFLEQMKKMVEWLQNAEEGLLMFHVYWYYNKVSRDIHI